MQLKLVSFIYKELGKELIMLSHSTDIDQDHAIMKRITSKEITPKVLYYYLTPEEWEKLIMDEMFKISHDNLKEVYKLPLESDEDLAIYMKYLAIPCIQYNKFWTPLKYYKINIHNLPDNLGVAELNISINPLYGYNIMLNNPIQELNNNEIIIIPYTDKLLPFFSEHNRNEIQN